jgi:hypothetical protein
MDERPNTAQERQAEQDQRIEHPAKIIRIGTMAGHLLDEVRRADLDETSRDRMREIYETSVQELAEVLPTELRSELEEITVPIGDGVPTDAELRVAQAQLVGWLQGLFQGIQASLVAQQSEGLSALEEMRRGRASPGELGPQDMPAGTYR